MITGGIYLFLQYMNACDGVFAAGDIADFPLKMLGWENVSIGHWQISHKHGMPSPIGCLQLADYFSVPSLVASRSP